MNKISHLSNKRVLFNHLRAVNLWIMSEHGFVNQRQLQHSTAINYTNRINLRFLSRRPLGEKPVVMLTSGRVNSDDK